MAFGLYNAPFGFQRAIIFAFSDFLYKFMMVFIDYFSTKFNAKDYLEYVEETLKRCRKIIISLYPKKIYLVIQKVIL